MLKKKIFIVDDEKDFLQLIKSILTRSGFEVVTDTDGGIVEKLKNSHADLFILDVNLGIKEGTEICKELKADSKTHDIPIILISAMKDLAVLSVKCGAEDYLFKPFDKSDLLHKINNQLHVA